MFKAMLFAMLLAVMACHAAPTEEIVQFARMSLRVAKDLIALGRSIGPEVSLEFCKKFALACDEKYGGDWNCFIGSDYVGWLHYRNYLFYQIRDGNNTTDIVIYNTGNLRVNINDQPEDNSTAEIVLGGVAKLSA